MPPDELRTFLNQKQVAFDEEPVQSGALFRGPGGEVYTVYKSGKLVIGGTWVLLTPDDEGHRAAHPEEKKYRARQNEPPMRRSVDRITTTIVRRWLADIIAGKKTVEYRAMKPYWRKRLASVSVPFELRLINGLQKHAPEVTVLIKKVRAAAADRRYELHIGKVLDYSNWDKRRDKPKAPRTR